MKADSRGAGETHGRRSSCTCSRCWLVAANATGADRRGRGMAEARGPLHRNGGARAAPATRSAVSSRKSSASAWGSSSCIDNRPARRRARSQAKPSPARRLTATPSAWPPPATHAIAPIFNPNLPYDPVKDFAPISMIGSSPYVLAVYPGLAANNVADLVRMAKAKPRPAQQRGVRHHQPRTFRRCAVCASQRRRAQPGRRIARRRKRFSTPSPAESRCSSARCRRRSRSFAKESCGRSRPPGPSASVTCRMFRRWPKPG